jgi:hypothetical protein
MIKRILITITFSIVLMVPRAAYPLIMSGNFVRTQINELRGHLGDGNDDPGLRHDAGGTATWGVEDYLTPYSPLEGFGLSFELAPAAGTNLVYNFNQSHPKSVYQIGVISTENRSGILHDHEFRWTGGIASYFNIEQTTYFDNDSEFIMFVIKLTAERDLYDIKYARFIDPDPDVLGGGNTNTQNNKGNVAAALAANEIVSATGQVSGLTVGLYSKSAQPHNTAISSGWTLTPSYFSDDAGPAGPTVEDAVIGIGFNLGNFVAGQFKYYTFAYVMGPNVASIALPPEPQVFSVTANVSSGNVPGVGGTITPPGVTFYLEDTEPNFISAANANYYLDYMEIDGVTVDASANYTFAPISENHAITANFHVYYTITSSHSSGGDISPLGTSNHENHSTASYTISPDADYYLSDILIDGVSVPTTSAYLFTDITKNYTIRAVFTPFNHIISTVSGNGSISPFGDVAYPDGSSGPYTITPDSHYRITGLVVDGVNLAATSNYTFSNIVTDHTIRAEFDNIYHTVSLQVSPNLTGEIESPSPLANVYTTATHNWREDVDSPRYEFNRSNNVWVLANVIVDGASLGPILDYTFSNIATSHAVILEMQPHTSIDPIFFGTGF